MKQEVYYIFCQDLNYWDMIKLFNARIIKIYKLFDSLSVYTIIGHLSLMRNILSRLAYW